MRPSSSGLTVQNCLSCPWRTNEFFCDVDDRTLKELEHASFATIYPPGAVLFGERQEPRGVFLLCRGNVKLSMTAADGKTLISRIAREGQAIGLARSIIGSAYRATAETTQRSQIRFIRRDDVLRLLTSARTAQNALRQVSREREDDLDHIAALGLSHSAAEKLAHFILRLAGTSSERREPGIRIPLLMTHEDIAQSIGTSRETVTRLLHAFRAADLISLSGTSLIIRDKPALEALDQV